MKKLTIGCALAASLALPGIASAADRHEVREAARECRADRAAMGAEEFRAQHGSLGRCIRAAVRADRRADRSARRQAVRECREQGLRGRELASCIRGEVREAEAEQRQEAREQRNAARDCRAERETLGEEAFREQYGTNHNKRNAFGKCVSSKVAEGDENSEAAQPEGGEGQDPPAAQGEGRGRPDGAGRPEGAGRPA